MATEVRSLNFCGLLRNTEFQIVHFHLQGANWIAKPLAALVGQKFSDRARPHERRLAFSRCAFALAGRLARICFLLGSSPFRMASAIFLQRWEAVPDDLIELVPNAVDDEIFRPCTEEQKRTARNKLSISADAFVAGGIGRLAPEKNFAMPAAISPYCMRTLSSSLRVPVPNASGSLRLASELGVDTRLRLLGTVLDRSSFYRRARCLHTSLTLRGSPDGYARSDVLRRSDDRLPRLEGIAAVIADEKEGLLAQPGDVADFSSKLKPAQRIAKAWAAQLARAARAKASSRFSASVTSRRIESIYRRELGIANVNAVDNNSMQ